MTVLCLFLEGRPVKTSCVPHQLSLETQRLKQVLGFDS